MRIATFLRRVRSGTRRARLALRNEGIGWTLISTASPSHAAAAAARAPRLSEKHNVALSAPTLSQPTAADAGHDRRDEAACPTTAKTTYKGSGGSTARRPSSPAATAASAARSRSPIAREGADVLISYLERARGRAGDEALVEEAGRKAVLVPGDIQDPAHCRGSHRQGGRGVRRHRHPRQQCGAPGDASRHRRHHRRGVGTDLQGQHPRDVLSHQGRGAAHEAGQLRSSTRHRSIPMCPIPTLLAYATTKGAIQNFTAGLAQMLAEKGIRANAVAPGPIWTPLIPSTMPEERSRISASRCR